MQYQQEQSENGVQKHQRLDFEQVETAAALATSRTAAQITSRFRDIEIIRDYFRVSSGIRSSATLTKERYSPS